jgi:hypothetical protein
MSCVAPDSRQNGPIPARGSLHCADPGAKRNVNFQRRAESADFAPMSTGENIRSPR